MSQSLNELTATELLNKLRMREFKVKDLAESCISQVLRLDSQIESFAYFDPELVLKKAEALDQKIQSNPQILDKKLCGIPVGIKDIFNTRLMPTQMGSPIWKNFQAGNDARVVHYLQMEESIVFGKTVTAEFAVHAPGPTKNPHNPLHTPGTSSSGSAAAVAARMVPVALGTQTAGSIIRPSSYCGIYGFKPSFGLIPRTGVLKTTDTLDTIGCLSRSTADLQLVFDIIRVKGNDFPICEKALNDKSRQSKKGKKWKVGVVRGPKWQDAEPYAQQALFEFVQKLEATGQIETLEINLAMQFDNAHQIHSNIYDRTLAYYFQREFKNHTLVSDNIYQIVSRGNQITLEQYLKALEEQNNLCQIFDDMMSQQCDILLGLSTGGEALKGLDSTDRPDNCLIWTLCGAPSINLPVFKGPLGLPFGAQITTRRYNDYLLLDFARELEKLNLIPAVTMPSLATSTVSANQSLSFSNKT